MPEYSVTLAYWTRATALSMTVIWVSGPPVVVWSPYQISVSPLAVHPVTTAGTQVMESPDTEVTWELTGVPPDVVQAWARVRTNVSPAETPLESVTVNIELFPAGPEAICTT